MKEVVTRKVVKPNDCALALSIPTTRVTFFRALETPGNRDLIPNVCPIWPEYYHHVIRVSSRILPQMSSLGVSIFPDVTLADFSSLLRSRKYLAVILFAHWKDDSVEFAEGIAALPAVIEAVPFSYRGIIDLCVCQPTQLAMELRETRPASVIRFTKAGATPALWLYFYQALFMNLHHADLGYLEAMELTIDQFFKSIPEGR